MIKPMIKISHNFLEEMMYGFINLKKSYIDQAEAEIYGFFLML